MMSDPDVIRQKIKLNEKAARFHRVFNTPEGKKVLQDLEEELNPDTLMGKDSHFTTYNVGRRDAFIYIQQLLRYYENAAREGRE